MEVEMPEEHHQHHDPTAWLDKEFFEGILKKALDDKELIIEDFFISLNAHAGEHYASTIYHATVQYMTKTHKNGALCMIVKLISSKVHKLANESSFRTEINIYNDIIPEMHRLLKQSGDEFNEIAPKLIYCSLEPQPIIILEDSTHHQYEMYRTQLGITNTKIIAAKLAKWHATSFTIGRRSGDVQTVQKYSNGLFNLKANDGLLFMQDNLRIFQEELSKWSGCEQYVEKFKNLHKVFMEKGMKIFKSENEEDSFNVLNHGDFHYNNMLVKLDERHDRIKDLLLVDFQLCFWGTPAIDIFYMLYLVASTETREHHKEEVIGHYYKAFVQTLKDIGYAQEVPSLIDLNNELKKSGFLEVVISVCFVPFLFADINAIMQEHKYDNSSDAQDLRRSLYNNPGYKTMIVNLLPTFLEKGILD